MRLSRVLVIAALTSVLVLSGCSTSDVELGDSIPVQSLRGDHLPPLYNTGFAEPLRVAIRDETLWEGAWNRLWVNYSESPALPFVDFDEHMVILVAMGERPSIGYSIKIEGAYRDGDNIVVRVVSTTPGRGCMVGAALTSPADIARMPASEMRVRFEERRVIRNCN